MRYIGNKSKMLENIETVITKYNITGTTFADLFAGTSTVGDYFNKLYTFSKNKDYFHPTTYRRSPRIFDFSYSRSKKGKERSIKVLTSSPYILSYNNMI